MAECHPVGFQWVMEAKRRGATIVHVDPRFTRTSAMADVYVPLRAGSDIAFLGGIVSYVLEHGREFREYIVKYTNAATIVADEFRDTEDLEGLFSGFDPATSSYDISSWQYKDAEETAAAAGQRELHAGSGGTGHRHGSHGGIAAGRPPHEDPTLEDPRCVFQLLRRHFSRYTPAVVEQVCGVPQQLFRRVADALCESSGPERTAAFVYSVGWTQHTVGVQYIRTAAIIQQLLGNVGRPGGGILALRGHASIQGSTDIPTLYNILPGYLPMPHTETHGDFESFAEIVRAPTGWWGDFEAYWVSLMKAYFGQHATAENDWLFKQLPRVDDDDWVYWTFQQMLGGKAEGYIVA